jgi:hypothetical protein
MFWLCEIPSQLTQHVSKAHAVNINCPYNVFVNLGHDDEALCRRTESSINI